MTIDFTHREKLTGHAVCSPSQLERILACPASVQEAVRAPITPPSSYAQHGTMLHEVAYEIITQKSTAQSRLNRLELEDRNLIEDALDYARDLLTRLLEPDTKMAVESRISLEDWGIPQVYGTLDLSLWEPKSKALHVIDWKFGAGVRVSAFNNSQLMAYAAGCMAKYGVYDDSPVFIHIVQPAIDNYDCWDVDQSTIAAWVDSTLVPGLKVAMSDDAPYHPGDKQCRWCPAAMTCRARLKWAQETAADTFRIHSKLATASKTELADVLKRVKDVIKYASQIEAYAAGELAAGREFPGYKLVAGRAIRAWADEKRAEAWLLGNSGIDESKLFTKKFISPAQAEKEDRLLKKNPDFESLIIKPAGKPQLASVDDKRPALEPSKEAASVFGDWQQNEEDT